jgi:ribosomal protein S18 acetylase RimI-like enzyme
MLASFTIVEIDGLNVDDLPALVEDSRREGFRFLQRLCDEYADGSNRFDQPGEALFGAFVDGQIVGVCGLNRDPYSGDARTGRVRRLYVAPEYRRTGVGRKLMEAVIERACEHFDRLVLRTDNGAAAAFYEAMGFHAETAITNPTHFMVCRS